MVTIESELSREDYEKLRAELSVDTTPPPGLIVHALVSEDSKLRVFCLWESSDAAQAFYQDRLVPAMSVTAPDVTPGPAKMSDVVDSLRT